MKLLLDTHLIIWTLTNDARLSEEAREYISSPEHIVYFSTVSLWEIAIKNQKAPEKCPYHEKDIHHYCLQAEYEVLHIVPAHILTLRTLQTEDGRYLSNQDPFDRLLIAQAKSENCLLLSHDVNFSNYRESCIRLI